MSDAELCDRVWEAAGVDVRDAVARVLAERDALKLAEREAAARLRSANLLVERAEAERDAARAEIARVAPALAIHGLCGYGMGKPEVTG